MENIKNLNSKYTEFKKVLDSYISQNVLLIDKNERMEKDFKKLQEEKTKLKEEKTKLQEEKTKLQEEKKH